MVFRSGPVAPGVAFVTGGARGLGNAIGVSFAKEGARGVCLVDIQDDATFEEGKKAVEKYGAKVLCIRADVTKEEDVERAVNEAVKEFGRIDYAANFAGIFGSTLPTWEMPADAFRQVMEVNTTGVWLCNKYQLRQMMKQDSVEVEEGRPPQRGSIVNCASVSESPCSSKFETVASQGLQYLCFQRLWIEAKDSADSIQAGAGTTGYTAAKHAVAGLTKAAALEARGHDIRVNAVSPGFLLTKLLDPFMEKYGSEQGMKQWEVHEKRQGRKATFDEIGDVVVLLSTPRMSLVVGHNLVIDGGFTINERTD
ncbi:2,5-dichloro-2,5-cyclohexadiene-1,4-diol dehydrogenase [Cladophialophora carrionii]|uniref:2,5-dichloro-2,5-cyclohexadiene-1,4-diol dehydrogenase n=1 Tax=Cladophialophora carrionii TaxID=86049 RepID=A0A1C1C746_9EURO|nr:2,5-dichloro-2,5-cyclohexadiene-1,4-diol dehydrogenase [Cladophialophora carrionii]